MFFTQEDYRKIEKWLLANSRKDTDFVGAVTPLKGNETVVLVQNGKNVKASIKDIVEQLFLLGVSDFVNITDKYGESYISLSQAIELIPFRSRKIGQVVTFLDDTGKWAMFQFQGTRKNQWGTLSLWVDLIDLMTGLTITDSEDIVTETNSANQVALKFADKTYNEADYSGLGRVYLRKNIQTVVNPNTMVTYSTNLLTQVMLSKENTVYIIQYDYSLNYQTISIPEGSVLLFEGGSIDNGAINCNGTTIVDKFSGNATIVGTYSFQDAQADEEDITQNQSSVLKFKDRKYEPDKYSGLGRKILRRRVIEIEDPVYGTQEKNLLLQEDFDDDNTVYVVRYDFTLNGQEITIPENCVLKFEGGQLKNGTINFNNTKLEGNIKINTSISGKINNDKILINWFNVDNTGSKDTTLVINNILKYTENKEIIFDGIYKVNPEASSSKEYDGGIRPISNQTLKFINNSKLIIDAQDTTYYSILSIYKVENVKVIGAILEGDINTHLTDTGEFGFGVTISSSKNIELYNCKSNYNWGDGYIFLSTGSEETNNFDCALYNCEAHYNRRQGLSITALYGGLINNFKATNTGILKYTAPAAGIDIEPDAIRYDERIKVIINNYISENNFGGSLHIVPVHLMHDNVTDSHREFYVQVNGLSSNLDGSRNTSVLLPSLRYSSVTTASNLSNKIKGFVELNNITISNSYMNPLEFRSMVDNGLPIIINNLTVVNPKVDSNFAKSMSAVLKFNNPTTYDYTNSVNLTINGLKVIDTRTENRVNYLLFSTLGNSPKNIHLFDVENPAMEEGSNIPYFIDDTSEVHYSILPTHIVNDDTNFLLSNTSNNYWNYRIIFNNPSTKSFRLPKSSTVSNFRITIENIQEVNTVHARFIAGDSINEPLVYTTDPSLELLPASSIEFVQRKDKSWDVYKSTDNIIPTLNPYYGNNKNAIAQSSNLKLGHSYYDTSLDTTLNYGTNGWQNPDGTYTNKVIIVSKISNIVANGVIYKIVSDIDLAGETLTIPINCTLDFQGGSFSNGTIILNNTIIRNVEGDISTVITATITGTYKAGQVLYDGTLLKMKLWNGTAWVNLDGTALI